MADAARALDDVAFRIVKNQRAPGAGRSLMRGLVAARPLDASKDNSYICDFHIDGVYPDAKSALKDPDSAEQFFVVQASQDKFIRLSRIDLRFNVQQKYANKLGNLANHACTRLANAKIATHIVGDTVTCTLRAVKPIKVGEPIYANYGKTSWTRNFGQTKRQNAKLYPNLCQGTKAPPSKKKKKNTEKKDSK
jgi:hypothetical protein